MGSGDDGVVLASARIRCGMSGIIGGFQNCLPSVPPFFALLAISRTDNPTNPMYVE